MVRDYTGKPAAAISISAPSFRLPIEKVPILAPLVCETAHAVSQEWGYRPEVTEEARLEKVRVDL
jgi:DNA-binding IclR family transcriptional regulator